METAVQNKKSVIVRPEGVDKFIGTTFEICTHKQSSWIADGTGGDTGIPANRMHSSKTMFVEPRSRVFIGEGKGYMPTQYVPGANTHYVEDYWEDQQGNIILDRISPSEAEKRKLIKKAGLITQYTRAELEGPLYRKAMDMGICFDKGRMELSKFSNDPVLFKFINDHEQNKSAPNADKNTDPTRLKLFMFQPLIRENKAAKVKVVESFDDDLDAITFIGKLRKKTEKGYEYNETMLDAVLFILQDGVGLEDGEVTQKFQLVVQAGKKDGKTFMSIINGVRDSYRVEVGKAENLDILQYEGMTAQVTSDGKRKEIYTFADGTSKEEFVDELITYFLATKIGRQEYKELKRQTEIAKIQQSKKQ